MKIVLLESLGISQEILDQYAQKLKAKGHTFENYPKDTDPKVQIERAKDADILMIANMPLSGEVIRACKNLKFIDVAFTGVDHVDLAAAKEMGVKVSNAAGYSTQAVAEIALCMMLSLLRNIPQVEERCREGKTKDGLVGCELRGKTVGIVGAGAIGCRTAELCHAFGCKVLGYKRHVKGDEPSFIEFVSLDELLSRSDIVSSLPNQRRLQKPHQCADHLQDEERCIFDQHSPRTSRRFSGSGRCIEQRLSLRCRNRCIRKRTTTRHRSSSAAQQKHHCYPTCCFCFC